MKSFQLLIKQNIYFLTIVIVHIIIQIFLLNKAPLVNDESFYLYDGLNINLGLIPFQDFTTKSGPFLYVIALWQLFFGYNILLSRFMMTLITSAILVTLYIFVKTYNKSIAILSVLLLALDFYFSSNSFLVMTNTPFMFGYILTILCFQKTLEKKNLFRITVTSLILTITFYIRQVAVFLLPLLVIVPLLQFFILHKNRTVLRKDLMTVSQIILIFVICVTTIYYFTLQSWGMIKAEQLLGVNSLSLTAKLYTEQSQFELLIDKFSIITDALNKFVFRSPLLFLSIIPLMLAYSGYIKDKFYTMFLQTLVCVSIGFFMYVTYLDYLKKYFGENPAKALLLFIVVIGIGITYLIRSLTYLNKSKKILINPQYVYLLILSVLTSIGIIGVYILYSKFEAVYEIYPLLAIPSAIVLFELWKNSSLKVKRFIIVPFIATCSIFSFYMNIKIPAVGSHTIADIQDAAEIIKAKTTSNDIVFTGFPAFAIAAERRVPFDVSHPTWYGYTHIPEEYRNIFLPDIFRYIELLQNNPPKVAVIDRYTKQTFLDSYPEIQKLFEQKYRIEKRYWTFDILVLKSSNPLENK